MDRATSPRLAPSEVAGELRGWTAGAAPLFRLLARGIAGGIERGAVPHGARLPSERALAAALHVSRGTAVAAYDLLVADGMVERRRGSGTYVAAAGSLSLPPDREGSALVHRLVDRSSAPGGVVDLSLSVLGDAAAIGDVGLRAGDLVDVVPATGYSPWGLPALRAALAGHVTRWGLPTGAGQVVVTTGAQQAISAAAACWLRPGDAVVVEEPTYPGAIAAFTAAGARLVGVPVDRAGVRVGPLRAALADRPALVYLQPVVHSPTGSVLAPGRRLEVARLLSEARVPVVEDRALADLAWEEPPAPLASLMPEASVAVVGSLSKLLWGGLRVGWVRAPEALALRFARVKATQDLGSSAVSQVLALRLLEEPRHSRLVGRRRAELRSRYEVLVRELSSALPGWTWDEPSGGLSLWVRLPGPRAEALALEAERRGVLVATAAGLSAGGGAPDRLRLSFALPPEEIVEGVRRLTSAWEALRR